ncbi:MAG: MgtC/SapB family protein, partial [Desulfomonilaceae bacterium]
PMLAYAHLTLRFKRDRTIPESELLEMITAQGFSIANMSYSTDREADFFEYAMTVRTAARGNMSRLSEVLSRNEYLIGFCLVQTGD